MNEHEIDDAEIATPAEPFGRDLRLWAESCRGCVNDFYNGNSALGVKHCWSLKTATPTKLYRIHKQVPPTTPGAFTQVIVYDCRRERAFSLYRELPECAVDPVLLADGGGS